jgi:hypothetical protein
MLQNPQQTYQKVKSNWEMLDLLHGHNIPSHEGGTQCVRVVLCPCSARVMQQSNPKAAV